MVQRFRESRAPALHRLGWQRGGLFDVVEGSNDLYGQGCCQAKPGYDLASGLGAPNFATWPSLLPGPGSRER